MFFFVIMSLKKKILFDIANSGYSSIIKKLIYLPSIIPILFSKLDRDKIMKKQSKIKIKLAEMPCTPKTGYIAAHPPSKNQLRPMRSINY